MNWPAGGEADPTAGQKQHSSWQGPFSSACMHAKSLSSNLRSSDSSQLYILHKRFSIIILCFLFHMGVITLKHLVFK